MKDYCEYCDREFSDVGNMSSIALEGMCIDCSSKEPVGFCSHCGHAIISQGYKVSDDDHIYCKHCLDVEGEENLLSYKF